MHNKKPLEEVSRGNAENTKNTKRGTKMRYFYDKPATHKSQVKSIEDLESLLTLLEESAEAMILAIQAYREVHGLKKGGKKC